jgi:hypothetical protein
MITFEPKTDIATIKIDKNDDIIPISVGLYKLFLAGGSDGLDAKTLYEHLIFTARLQETQQVYANNEYLRAGLHWGLAKIKKAKAWLVAAGLIAYVQYRSPDGTLSDVYIRITFMLSRETLNAKLAGASGDGWAPPAPPVAEPAPCDQYSFDFAPGPAEEAETIAVDFSTQAVVTGGSFTAPPVNRTTGAERQMLETNNQMLEVKKEMSLSPPAPYAERFHFNPNGTLPGAEEQARQITFAWYREFTKKTGRLINPGHGDIEEARALVYRIPELMQPEASGVYEKAIEKHFALWAEAWYLTLETTRKLPAEARRPYWNFKNFCRHFVEIVDDLAPPPEIQKNPGETGPKGATRAGGGRNDSHGAGWLSEEEIERLVADAQKKAGL